MLEGMMLDIRERFGAVRFTIPTIAPDFIRRTYVGLDAHPVPSLPWRGSVRLLGRPVWKALREADVILVTDAILFDRNLFNPVKNYLSSLALLLPPARRRGVPVVLYNVSLGPVGSRAGRWCLKRVLESADAVILRDETSRRTLSRLRLSYRHVYTGGDAALGATPAADMAIRQALHARGVRDTGRPVVGFNMNSYGAAFLRRGHARLSPDRTVRMLADTIRWIRHELGADVWIFCTQHMDEPLCRQLQREAGADETPLFTNRECGHRLLLGLMSKLSLMVGMRTHSMILASSWGTPVVGIVTYPKTLGYLERINQEARSLPITDLDETRLRTLIGRTWETRADVSAELTPLVDSQRRLSKSATEYLRPYLEIQASPWAGPVVEEPRRQAVAAR